MSNSNGNQYMVYNTDGTLDEGGQVFYSICDDRDENFGRQIAISLVGRAALIYPVSSSSVNDCTP